LLVFGAVYHQGKIYMLILLTLKKQERPKQIEMNITQARKGIGRKGPAKFPFRIFYY
jgi:hypothetical protein